MLTCSIMLPSIGKIFLMFVELCSGNKLLTPVRPPTFIILITRFFLRKTWLTKGIQRANSVDLDEVSHYQYSFQIQFNLCLWLPLRQSVCVYSNSRNDVPRVAQRNHCRTHPAPCVRPRRVSSVLRARVQFCRFDKADATGDVQ